MNGPAKLVLTVEDKASPLWKKLTAHWSVRLEQARDQLEGEKDEVTTACIRGRIKEIRANLRLADPPKTD